MPEIGILTDTEPRQNKVALQKKLWVAKTAFQLLRVAMTKPQIRGVVDTGPTPEKRSAALSERQQQKTRQMTNRPYEGGDLQHVQTFNN